MNKTVGVQKNVLMVQHQHSYILIKPNTQKKNYCMLLPARASLACNKTRVKWTKALCLSMLEIQFQNSQLFGEKN